MTLGKSGRLQGIRTGEGGAVNLRNASLAQTMVPTNNKKVNTSWKHCVNGFILSIEKSLRGTETFPLSSDVFLCVYIVSGASSVFIDESSP